MNFGLFLTPDAGAYGSLRWQVQAAERGGLDLIGIQDHPYQPRFFDTFALIADLLARTERLRFFPDVANLALRPPAMLAKTGASLDVMSGGRFELGIGAGAFWDGVEAMGGPRRAPGESVEALEEAIQILRRAWSGERSVTFEGKHYSVRGFHPGPPPAHPIRIWVGSYQPRMLALTGRLADGWLPSMPYAPPETIAGRQRRIDEAAEAAGRDPSEIRRIYNVGGEIVDGPTQGLLQGPVSHWIETLADFALELRFDDFMFWPTGGDPVEQIELFAREVVPGVREMVGEAEAIEEEAAQGEIPPAPPMFDEATRPRAPKPEDAEPAGDGLVAGGGQHLVEIHNHLRHEMAQVVQILDAVADGRLDAAHAREQIDELSIMKNFRWIAQFCMRYCQVVQVHHTIEDRHMFVSLREADASLDPVLERLQQEHEVIHGLLTRLDALLIELGEGGQRAEEVAAEARRLEKALLSHLDYEEEELLEPISRLSIPV